jgi:hypothetical protein
MMRSRPKYAPALRAGKKPFLCGKDIRRNEFFDGIAFQATAKGLRQRLEATGFDHLAQLLPVAVAFDEYKVRRLHLFKATIASENQPVFFARGMNQTVTGQMGPVDNVLTHDAEPFGKFAKHAVGGEFHGLMVAIHEDFGLNRLP